MQDQVRTGYERTRRTTARAMRIGILRVDLLSLRRDRTRAMAQLGERAFSRWNEGTLATFDDDLEALRLRSLVEGVERCIASKEMELEQLRNEESGFSESNDGGPRPPQTGGTNGIS